MMRRALNRRPRARPVLPALSALPLAPWLQLGTRSLEMLLASGQVIAMRLTRMAAAGPRPGTRDRKEFVRMGSEKLQAATQSALAVGALWPSIGWQLWAGAWQAWLGGLAGGARRRAGSGAPLHHAARIAHAALEPVHRAATANARRLSRGGVRRRAAG
jgi:hypothetical protein